jgi:Spy/CpxP family protein refolding chaperone
MNLMKHITFRLFSVVALVATLALPAALGADGDKPTPPPGGGPGGGKRPDRGDAARPQRDAWLKEIGASEDQATKIREILKDQMDQQRTLRQNADLTPEQRRSKMSEIRAATTAKIKGILTPDQFAKYEKLQEERRPWGSRWSRWSRWWQAASRWWPGWRGWRGWPRGRQAQQAPREPGRLIPLDPIPFRSKTAGHPPGCPVFGRSSDIVGRR